MRGIGLLFFPQNILLGQFFLRQQLMQSQGLDELGMSVGKCRELHAGMTIGTRGPISQATVHRGNPSGGIAGRDLQEPAQAPFKLPPTKCQDITKLRVPIKLALPARLGLITCRAMFRLDNCLDV